MQTFREILRGGVSVPDVIGQMASIGFDSIVIVLTITTATGAVFAFYTANLAMQIGFTSFVGGTVAYALLNELGPLLGGVALAARVGAAIAAEIGSMVVTEQVDALRAMAVSPVRYLVAPRVLATVVMLPLLIILGDASGLLGSFLFATLKGIPGAEFWISVHTYATTSNFFSGLTKAVVFGFLIGIVACHQGLKTTGGATGVGRSTTSSVVLCVVLIFISDVFLAQMLTGAAAHR